VRLLPLFPLPVVLFPGAPLPLHIFEPRYRRLLDDCLRGDGELGMIYRAEDDDEELLQSGRIGCVARVTQSEMLSDGRSNVIVRGIRRFTFHRYVVTDAPYRVGEVSDFDDDDAEPLIAPAQVDVVREMFERLGRAARDIADDTDPLPELPRDPSLVSFAIAGYVGLDPEHRQRLLASRSPRERLREIEALLARAVHPMETQAAVHRRAGSNGHGPTLVDGT